MTGTMNPAKTMLKQFRKKLQFVVEPATTLSILITVLLDCAHGTATLEIQPTIGNEDHWATGHLYLSGLRCVIFISCLGIDSGSTAAESHYVRERGGVTDTYSLIICNPEISSRQDVSELTLHALKREADVLCQTFLARIGGKNFNGVHYAWVDYP